MCGYRILGGLWLHSQIYAPTWEDCGDVICGVQMLADDKIIA
jgi:hypothetical protein